MKSFSLKPQLPIGIRLSRGVLATQSVTLWIGGMGPLFISVISAVAGIFLAALFFFGIAALLCGIGAVLWWFRSKLHRIFDKWVLSTLIAEVALILLGAGQLAIENMPAAQHNQDTGNPFADGGNGLIELSGLLFVIGGFLVMVLFIWELVWKLFQNHTK